MYRLVVMYHKPEDVEKWNDHYYNVHLPLARRIPNTRKLTVSSTIDPMAGDNPYHLIAEMEWDSKESMLEALQSPEGHASHDDFESFAKGKVIMIGFEVEDASAAGEGL